MNIFDFLLFASCAWALWCMVSAIEDVSEELAKLRQLLEDDE
jgi:hypothetical protein